MFNKLKLKKCSFFLVDYFRRRFSVVFLHPKIRYQVFENMVIVSMVYSLTAQLRLWRSHLLWKHWKLFLQLSQTSLCDDSSEHSDHTAKTFRRLLWSKKFSPYCGENLGGVKRHLWLGADTAGGVGGGGVMACGRISRPANCPAPDQNCPRIFGSPDPSVLSPRRSSWLSEARPSYRPLFAPTVISNVRSSQSWICTLSDRKWRETMQCRKKADLKKGEIYLRIFAGAWKSAEGNCHLKSISSTIRLRKSSGTIRSRNLREIAFPRILVYMYKCIDTFVVLMSTQSKLARPNVLGLPRGVRTPKISQFGNVVQISHKCNPHYTNFCPTHRMKENPGK